MNQVWTIPVWLGIVTLFGIASAILGDGVWDWGCWAALALPLGIIAERVWRQRA